MVGVTQGKEEKAEEDVTLRLMSIKFKAKSGKIDTDNYQVESMEWAKVEWIQEETKPIKQLSDVCGNRTHSAFPFPEQRRSLHNAAEEKQSGSCLASSRG